MNEETFLEAAYRLFRKKGIQAVNLQQIAHACSISLLEIKFMYKSKNELVSAVLWYTLNKKSNYLSISSSLSPSSVAELNNFFKFVDNNINELGQGIFTELKKYHPLALNQIKEWVDIRLAPYVQRVIERGLREGFCRDDLNYELYVPTYFYILRSILENDCNNWEEIMQMISHINDVFFHGVLNAKGMRV